jgi:hypothetical protein
VRRKGVWIVLALFAGIETLVVFALATMAYGHVSEAAMTSCLASSSGVPKDASVTVESRFPPWKFTCIFWDRSGRVVAKRPAPYEPPWPWR